ncbi:MFS transporter [Sneathiella marina]|uniref:MFS transporter n=1 Tax=Sneathiella marina TaxID=2950108 RepID=A0ABY4W448_9PROT|nr:MFS transporter [Sneathiella marina]USG60893.1 MFS transporter [Sneathiella marina]
MANFKLGRSTRFCYGIGAVAYGVKDSGFTTFLMIYYNQVLGLSLFYTGLAILIALAFDAVSDPYIGHLSDNWRSRLGRRHPFMYVAIIPILLSYFYLWNPPADLSGMGLLVFLIIIAVAVRLFITFFEIPNAAMLAELSRGYDDRTALMSLRNTMGWLGGVVMAIIAYVFFLVPTDTIETGVLNMQGYQSFGLLAAIVMVVTMLISALGTHKLIPFLPQPKEQSGKAQPSFKNNLKVVFKNPSFRALFIAASFSMMAFGVIITLQIYFATFLFGLNNNQISLFPLCMILAALMALWLTPRLARGYEKRSVIRFLALGCLLITNIALILRLLGWLPENGHPLLLPILLVHILISTGFLVALQTVFGSMTADLVEDTERVTGYRIEGLYFAAISFSKKLVSGLGIFASGIFLSTANSDGEPITQTVMIDVSLVYIPFVMLLYFLTFVYCGRYRLTRQMHEENLSTLKILT